MRYARFAFFNLIGGLLWAVGVTSLGFGLGNAIDIDKYLLPVIVGIVFLSLLPVIIEIRRERRKGSRVR